MHLRGSQPPHAAYIRVQAHKKFRHSFWKRNADKESLCTHRRSLNSRPERETSPSGPVGDGNNVFTSLVTFPLTLGNNALPRIAACATNGKVNDGTPRRQAETIRAAACSTLMELRGIAVESENQVCSAEWLPLKWAFPCDPVRISPGVTVVTQMCSRANSARRESDKPTSANL